MQPQTKVRIDEFWCRVFGVAAADGGLLVVPHGPLLAGSPRVYCVVRERTVLVSTPADLVDRVTTWAPNVHTALQPRWWQERLPGWHASEAVVHRFLDHEEALGCAAGRPGEPRHLMALHRQVTEAEWIESGFGEDGVLRAWVVLDHRENVVAAANLTSFGGIPADVGVLAAGASRGRGFASAAAATAARFAVRRHGIARWRALTSNQPSLAVAARLGFVHDSVRVEIVPAPTADLSEHRLRQVCQGAATGRP